MRFGVLLLIALVVPLVFSNTATDAPIILGTTKICVDPTIKTNHVGYIFSVDINVTEVTNMWTWNFTLYYSRALLYCKYAQNFSASSWVSCTAIGPTIEQSYNTSHGRVRAYMSATSGSVFNGSMIIATIYFNVTAVTGTCALDIRDSMIKDKSGSSITHDEYDGTFQTGQYTKVAFRFLGVESGDNENFCSAQQLAQNLTRFLNWQNVTWGKYNYTSYVHLLSNASNAQSSPYYVGQATKANVISEAQNFLGATGPGENNSLTVRIFCFVDHGTKYYADVNHTAVPALQLEKYEIPEKPGSYAHSLLNDTQLNETLNSGDLVSSNCVLALIDCCYAGSFLNKTQSGRVVLTCCKYDEKSWGWQGQSSPPPGYWSDFMGNENAQFGNYTVYGPLGIIGGLFNADDTNYDNWRSAGEIFNFANKTTIEYTTGEKQRSGSTEIQHPQSFYGVISGGIPIVMHDKYSSLLKLWMPWGENYMEPAEFPYNAMPIPKGTFLGPIVQWGMLGSCPSRTSYSPSKGPAQPGLLWSRSPLSPIRSSAAISAKIVILGSENGTLYAFDLQTGENVWQFDCGASVKSSPAVADGMVFFGTDSGRVYALDEGTGMVRWSYQTMPSEGPIVSSPGVCNGTVFICSSGGGGGGCLYALNEVGGYQIWNFSTGAGIESSPAVSNSMVFIGSANGMVYALNMTDGALRWGYPILPISPIVSTAAVSEQMVYVTSMNGRVYALDLLGHYQWDFATGGPITSSPALDKASNLVLVGSQDGYLYALDRMTGGLPVWKRYIGIMDRSSPAISSDGLIYVGTTNNLFYCINETSSDVVWGYSTPGPVYSSPALTDEHAVVSSYDGTLCCFGREFPYHDVAVLGVNVSHSSVRLGANVTVEYVITNLGNRIEVFNVTVAHDNASAIWTPPLYEEPVPFHTEALTLQPGQTVNLTCEWCTLGRAPGSYRIVVIVPSIEYDNDQSSNAYVTEPIEITTGGSGGGGGGRVPYVR
jgi:outer membrane protein assembly factor BamB